MRVTGVRCGAGRCRGCDPQASTRSGVPEIGTATGDRAGRESAAVVEATAVGTVGAYSAASCAGIGGTAPRRSEIFRTVCDAERAASDRRTTDALHRPRSGPTATARISRSRRSVPSLPRYVPLSTHPPAAASNRRALLAIRKVTTCSPLASHAGPDGSPLCRSPSPVPRTSNPPPLGRCCADFPRMDSPSAERSDADATGDNLDGCGDLLCQSTGSSVFAPHRTTIGRTPGSGR